MVETAMWAASAASAACSGARPAVLAPSDSSTIRAGGGLAPAWSSKLAIASIELKTASPMAVAGPVWRLRTPALTAWWSVVGATITEAEPSKATSPTLKRLKDDDLPQLLRRKVHRTILHP